MTKQEFVKNEACIYAEKVSFQVPYNGTNDFYNEERLKTSTIDFSDGLTKGLEIAEGFYEFVQDFTLQELAEKTTSELLTIFLTEKYGNNG